MTDTREPLDAERLRQARSAALDAARDVMPVETYASYPLPVAWPGGPALGVLLCRYLDDPASAVLRLYEPEAAVIVDPTSLEPLERQTWRQPAGYEEPIASRLPPAARALPARHLAALEYELLTLLLAVSGLPASVAQADRDGEGTVLRFDRLFRFLVPAELFPHYQRLSPGLFEWLLDQTGVESLQQLEEPPEPEVELPPHLEPPRPDPLLVGRSFRPGIDWRLTAGALAQALRDLDLVPEKHSPLRRLDRSTPVEGFTLAELVPDWPTEPWREALHALCDPEWLIERDLGDAQGSLTDRYYVGRDRQPVVGILHDAMDDQHLVSFPRRVREIRDVLPAWLGAAGAEAAGEPPRQWRVRWSELRAILALADLRPEVDGDEWEVAPDDLAGASERPDEAGELRWTPLGPGFCSITLPPAKLEHGLDRLVERGWLERSEGRVRPLGPLQQLLAAMERPVAYGRLRVLRYQAGDCTTGRGFLAVRAGGGLWLGQTAQAWECGQAVPADPQFHLLRLSGVELVAHVDALLGTESSTP